VLCSMAPKKVPLARALDVVRRLMALPDAQQLFNHPVDASAPKLKDYNAVVQHPIDLGSIEAVLAEAEAAQWTSGAFESPEQVWHAINMVWSNCLSYNVREDEREIADAARELAVAALQLWRKAGLETVDVVPLPEHNVSPFFDSYGVQLLILPSVVLLHSSVCHCMHSAALNFTAPHTRCIALRFTIHAMSS
jgi:Bromodomain